MDSILTSIKELLGITEEQTHFDQQIIMHINTVLMGLSQMGVGPEKGFTINNSFTTWSQFVSANDNLEAVKSYVYLKVKLLFDPPLSSAHIESINRQIAEFEWRLNVGAETDSI